MSKAPFWPVADLQSRPLSTVDFAMEEKQFRLIRSADKYSRRPL
jgi:hypothetical protein